MIRVVFFVLALVAAGCAAGQSSRRGEGGVSDAWINTRAENEITPLITSQERVTIATQNGVVFLDGHVESVDRAERLEQVASDIRGVREVKNNLVIKP